jgi:mannose-6-phosphate isomerase
MRPRAAPPLTLLPIPMVRPWGGDRGAARIDARAQAESTARAAAGPIGEWWLASARAGAVSRVLGGPLAGRGLDELLSSDADLIFGAGAAATFASRFPLLVKLLDTAAPLSVQVHPSDAALPGEGKTESWYVIEATGDAHFWLGLKPGATPAEVVAAARRGESPEPLLLRHAASRGLLAHLPPGTIHALGAGIVALEIQTNADTTWRIWDWGRKPERALHLDEAARDAAADQRPRLLDATPDPAGSPPRDRLVDCESYRVERMRISSPTHLATDGDRFELLLSLDAGLRVRGEPGAADAPRGHVVLIPAPLGDFVVTPAASCELLRLLPARSGQARSPR